MTEATWQHNVDKLIAELKKTAVERDRKGGHPQEVRFLIKKLGLLDLIIEKRWGGQGLLWSEILQIVQDVATVDSAIAHILAFHYLQVISIKLYGDSQQYSYFSRLTKENNLFWGNALNPNDKRAKAVKNSDGFLIDGIKSYCSGSVGSDILLISAWDENSSGFVIGVVYSDDNGVQIRQDWDAFGQKQTDSGTVLFENVLLKTEWTLLTAESELTPKQSLRTLLAQSILTNLFIGLSRGSLNEAKNFLQQGKKAWFASQADLAIRDEFHQHHIAKLYVATQAAIALDRQTRVTIDQLLSRDDDFTFEDRGSLAIQQMTARIAAHEAVLKTTSQIFDVMGASATSNKLGLDRLWRNARVHTLHDPIDYKLKDLGQYFLEDIFPTPTAYS
ncbi:monooxygenase [Neisseriaceae bacterium PsAf]|nr:monooxygenase [Neisseriaceae bacterium PsAf]MCV2502850.1 acyl-CoA dehydrogenase family protein [Neisseriaceae bacterium]